MLHARPGASGAILLAVEKLKKTQQGIKSVDYVYGTFDLVVTVETESEDEFMRTLAAIASTEHVTATNTLIVASRELALKYASP